ncbi:hypothetical protein [Arthrobacter sp. Br18]|uniref:hypothetical protein n=1 Tax=Arthrobacter sp. Br18 TaxID=1312954 RepID=UPI00047B93C4|nr:hypothetical protein [Arthrobacter sp. Br18]
MARSQPGKPTQGRMRYGIKGPLLFSAVLGLVAGVATSIFATGGGSKEFRLDLGLTAGGIAFIVSLVVCAMLMMAEIPNPEHLGKGSGVNRSSANPDRPAADTSAAGSSGAAQPGADEQPRYGQRLPDSGA